MGNYVPGRKTAKPDLSHALMEAEHDHLLDCPNAEAAPRIAATLLDLILVFLLLSGTQSFFEACLGRLPRPSELHSELVRTALERAPDALNYAASVVKLSVLYFYAIWSVMQYGGTPGKMLLGLRVVDAATGMRLTFGRLVLREVIGKALGTSLLGVGLFMSVIRRDRRALHDLVSRSVVKKVLGGSP